MAVTMYLFDNVPRGSCPRSQTQSSTESEASKTVVRLSSTGREALAARRVSRLASLQKWQKVAFRCGL
jgi:hypothetical protein